MKILDTILEDYRAAELAELWNTTERLAALKYLHEAYTEELYEVNDQPRPKYAERIADDLDGDETTLYHDFGAGYYFLAVA